MTTISRDFYNDPSHGWCKVSLTELKLLGIADKISSYSYQRGEYIYLEEDCDLSTYILAVRAKGDDVSFREHDTNRQSRIRRFASYKSTASYNC